MPPPNSETPPGMPRWVKLFVLIGILVILLVVIIMFVVGGDHGPGGHAPGLLAGFAPQSFGLGSSRSASQGKAVAGDTISAEGDHW